MCSDIVRSVRKFCADKRGNFAMIFAMAAPVAAVAMAGALDYSDAVMLNARAQSAADAAALAASQAAAAAIASAEQTNNAPMTQAAAHTLAQSVAQSVASEYFNGNAASALLSAPACASSGTVGGTGNVVAGAASNFNSTTTVSAADVVTTTATYCGAPASVVGGLLGSTMNVDIKSTSQSNVTTNTTTTTTTTTTTPVGAASGNGWVDEDPVVQGANGQYWFMDTCDVTHATWYNLLSDTNFEVNANCDGNPYQSELYQFTVLAGTHVISVSPTLNPEWWDNAVWVNQEAWAGGVTIDGTFYAASSGTHTYLNDTANQITVQVVVGQPGVYGSSSNYVLVTAPSYSVTIAYDTDDVSSYWSFGLADIHIGVTDAGACGAPGGVWGQTLSVSGTDANFEDFRVSSSTSKASQFTRTCTTTTTTTTSTTTAATGAAVLTQ